MGEQNAPPEKAPDEPSQRGAHPLRLPRGRNASPWTFRLVLIAAIVVVILAPLWIDPMTLNALRGADASSAPPGTDTLGQLTGPATEDPSVTWTVIGRDSAASGDADAWGTAELGGSWQASSVAGLTIATLGSLSSHDTSVDFTMTLQALPGGDALLAGAVLRRNGDGAAYLPEILVDNQGTVSVAIEILDGTVRRTVELTTPVAGLITAAGVPLHVRAQVTGTDPARISVRAWTTRDSGYWQLGAIDWTGFLQSAGGVGLTWTTTGGNQPQFTNFSASSADMGELQ